MRIRNMGNKENGGYGVCKLEREVTMRMRANWTEAILGTREVSQRVLGVRWKDRSSMRVILTHSHYRIQIRQYHTEFERPECGD